MVRWLRWACGLIVLSLASFPAARAQVIETPVAFDSAGRVTTLTPATAQQLGLAPPAFVVQGTFMSARLYASSAGGHVLVVERAGGIVERYALSDAAFADLRRMVTLAVAGGTRLPGETVLPSEPAARQFARNQFILSVVLYGPNLAALANDAQTGTVLYLLGSAGTFYGVTALTRGNTITRAQNHLATDGAWRGWGAANGLLIAFAGDQRLDRQVHAAIGLVGALGGVATGLRYGRTMTDAEAVSATQMSTFAALTTLGLLGTAGLEDRPNTERTIAASLVAAGVAGYVLGPSWPRRASYRVTAGDAEVLWLGAALGTGAAMIPVIDSDIEQRTGFGLATAGFLAGTFAAERLLSRRFDHSGSDVTMLYLGTIAGGLVGSAGIVLFEPSDAGAGLAMVVAGATAGAFVTHKLLRVPRDGGAMRVGSVRLEFDPMALALAASRAPGTHAVVRARF